MSRRFQWRPRGLYPTGIGALVLKARRGDPRAIDELLEQLRQPDAQLKQPDLGWLANLIEKNVSRNGRPRGSLTPENAAILYASYLFRIGKQFWCRKHARQRATDKNLNKAMLKRSIELIEVEIPEARGQVDEDEVKASSNLLPIAEVKETVHEYLPDQVEEIIKIALEE
jgi:hypothetical protein